MAYPIALVVDDEPLILMDTSDIVSNAGYQVLEARNAEEALKILDTHHSVRLLVTDIQMPGKLDGLALARDVGKRWPHIHIVVASGAVTPGLGELPVGAQFIGKPLDRRVILDVLKEFSPIS